MNREPVGAKPTVIVIDDDQSVRAALVGLFELVDLAVVAYGSVQEYSSKESTDRADCIVLDIRLPGQSGLEFQETLVRSGACSSVVLISGHVDVAMSVRAMKAGAIDVFTKPVREQVLLDAVQRAIATRTSRRADAKIREKLEHRYATLTKRECQIMALVVTGLQNRLIAERLSISEATVKLHRGQVMQKMGADSLPALVRIADLLDHCQPRPCSSEARLRYSF